MANDSPTKKDLIEQLETLTIETLISRIRDGEASAAELSVARGILNDNKTLLLLGERDGAAPLQSLADTLPFAEEPEGPTRTYGS